MEKRTIAITGTSRLNVKTDYVRIRFDIAKVNLSYEKALAELTEQANKVAEIVAKTGFQKTDLKTADFNIRKETKYDIKSEAYVFIGYKASETLHLSFPIDNKRINAILTRLCQEIVDVAFTISFYCDNPGKYENRLIELAVKDAKEKAELIANAANVKLLNIDRINYSFSEIHIEERLEYALGGTGIRVDGGAALPDMEPEDTELNKTITIVWEIK